MNSEKTCAIDAIEEAKERDRSFVIEELDFERRVRLAREGDIASEEEVSAAFSKWKR